MTEPRITQSFISIGLGEGLVSELCGHDVSVWVPPDIREGIWLELADARWSEPCRTLLTVDEAYRLVQMLGNAIGQHLG